VLTFVLQGGDPSHVETFDLDHHYPGSQNNSLTVVLYGELGTQEFAEFHQVLKMYAVKGDIDYVLRHYVKVSAKGAVNIDT
jgi:UDP-glucose:glycoprotein glucosyltransferase